MQTEEYIHNRALFDMKARQMVASQAGSSSSSRSQHLSAQQQQQLQEPEHHQHHRQQQQKGEGQNPQQQPHQLRALHVQPCQQQQQQQQEEPAAINHEQQQGDMQQSRESHHARCRSRSPKRPAVQHPDQHRDVGLGTDQANRSRSSSPRQRQGLPAEAVSG